jgi:hypothetical protein
MYWAPATVVPANQVIAFSPRYLFPVAESNAGFDMNSTGSGSYTETACPPSDELWAETGSRRNSKELSRLCARTEFTPIRIEINATVRRLFFIGNKCTKNVQNMVTF